MWSRFHQLEGGREGGRKEGRKEGREGGREEGSELGMIYINWLFNGSGKFCPSIFHTTMRMK